MQSGSARQNGFLRVLLSALAVGSAFALGRMLSSRIRRLVERADEVVIVTPNVERVFIEAEPSRVYETARRLEYFNQFLFGVSSIELINPASAKLVVEENGSEYTLDLEVIDDQPGEFFGLRVEYEGRLYGTLLIQFDEATGVQARGTIVTMTSRYKIELPVALMNQIKPVVAREIDVYLSNLKDSCERELVANK